MNKVKIISRILFYLTRFLSVFYFWMPAHSILALLTGWSLTFKENGKYFNVCWPFTQKPFLVGDYNIGYIVFEFLIPLSLYGLFFLLVGNVFKIFFQDKMFTPNNVRHLKRFYWANLILPGVAVLLASIFAELDELAEILIALHFFLGIFAYFLAAIFKQGLNLQNEQDLFI